MVKCVEPGWRALGWGPPNHSLHSGRRVAWPCLLGCTFLLSWVRLRPPRAQAPSQQKPQGSSGACLLPARPPGRGINYPSDGDVTFNGSCSIMLIHPIILL